MVRPARPGDEASLRDLHHRLYRFHHENNPVVFKGVGTGPGDEHSEFDLESTLVFEDAGLVVGFLCYGLHEVKESTLLHRRNMVVVLDLFVADEARRRGVGRSLLEAVDQVARDRGCDSIEIPVFSFNHGALEFYRRQGYGEYVRRLRKSLVAGAVVHRSRGR